MTAIEGVATAELDYNARRGRGSRPTARGARPDAPRRAGGERLADRSAPAKERPAPRRQRPAARSSARPDLPSARPDLPLARSELSAEPTPRAKNGNGATVTLFPRAAEPRRPRQPERRPDEDRKVVGFGDDLPAFLARPPRIVARP